MAPPDTAVDRLLRYLPAIPELAPLRESIVGLSVPDPERAWDRASSDATFDKRVVPAARLKEAVQRAAEAARSRVDRLYATLGAVLSDAADGDEAGAVARLLDAAAAGEAAERWAEAIAFNELAAALAEPLPDRRPLLGALRAQARVRVAAGDFEEGYAVYRRVAEQAELIGEREARVAAETGSGNVRLFQGRWEEARRHYEAALALCSDEDVRLRARLAVNLAAVTCEQGRSDAAHAWLESALAVWDRLERRDHCGCFNMQGVLWLRSGEAEKAEAAFRQALELAETRLDRATALGNLAELHADSGRLGEAETLARQAEEHALAAASPHTLVEVYTRLGQIRRLAADPNGVTFFEKALELCRERPNPSLEGRVCLEYGLFRRALGDADEARALLIRARDLFARLGAGEEHERAVFELAVPATPPASPPPAG